jgi:RNA polymerase sigma-70 factor (ECF subfamily)
VLLAAARDGDEHAFGLLWRRTNPGLLRYLRVVAPGRAQPAGAATWGELVHVLATFRGAEAQWRTGQL